MAPMGRALHYVGTLFLLSGASTPFWWAAARFVRAEYRGLMSAIACSMRIFFYSFCLLCLLVAARSFHLEPADPKSTLFRDVHAYGTLALTFPCAWRAFRVTRAKCVLLTLLALALAGAAGYAAWAILPGFRAALLYAHGFLLRAR
jgi:hypothetical protein